MSEVSRPWNGTTLGHAGPYTYQNWNDVWGATSRASVQNGRSADYNIGVFYAITNALVATINGANIDVDTGASQIDGLYHENDATVSVPITAAAAGNERKDLIVVRRNYQTAVTYTPAGGAPTVPPHEAHITVIRGSECVSPCSPATPAMTQDTARGTYWDIPIATVEVDDVPNLTSLTDLREYVDAETKEVILPILHSENTTDGTFPLTGLTSGLGLLNNKLCTVQSYCIIPNDFITNAKITHIVDPDLTGNYYGLLKAEYGAIGEAFLTHSNTTGVVVVAVGTADVLTEIQEITLTSATIGDIVLVTSYRDAVNVLDTIAGTVYERGSKLSYLGWKK